MSAFTHSLLSLIQILMNVSPKVFSVIDMKLNPTTAIHTLRVDSVDVVPYQKSGELSYFSFVTQQIGLGRTLLRKVHKNTIITEIDIQVELIETDFSADLVPR